MKRTSRSSSFIFTALGTLALLLAASGLSAFSFVQYPDEPDYTYRHAPAATGTPDIAATITPMLAPTETPGAVPSGTPGMLPTGTPGATTNAQGIYMGEIPNPLDTRAPALFTLDSNGKEIVAFVTDGTKDHTATYAHWYKGPLQENKVSAVPEQANQGKLDATLTQNTATGSITLPGGKVLPFTADVLQPASANPGAGLYKGEKVVNGEDYVAGWVLAPNSVLTPSATATPSATGTPAVGPTETPSPSVMLSPTATPTLVPSPSVTLSPTATPLISGIIQGGALFNKKTNKVQSLPELTLQNVQTKKANVPGLGEFSLVPCQQNLC